uniref:hypothetical protein n=1 Tax=Pseudomonas viridiflava TaxID=33069 RepID=UPI00198013A9
SHVSSAQPGFKGLGVDFKARTGSAGALLLIQNGAGCIERLELLSEATALSVGGELFNLNSF